MAETVSQSKPTRKQRDLSRYPKSWQRMFETVACDVCGARIQRAEKARHERTKKLRETQYLWFDRFELK